MTDIVIVAFNTEQVLPKCIETVSADAATGEIFVVNNSPGRPTGVEGRDKVTILEPGSNIGFGPGVNFARQHISSDFVAIINPDLVVDQSTLSRCLNEIREDRSVALLSPRVYVEDKLYRSSEKELSLSRLLAYPLGIGRWLGVERRESAHKNTHYTDAVNGAFMVARKEALDSVNWFDPDIFLFGEEIDLCRRLRHRGWKIKYLAEGHVDHLDGYSSEEAPFDVRIVKQQARIEQLRRARGEFQATLYTGILRLTGRYRPSPSEASGG